MPRFKSRRTALLTFTTTAISLAIAAAPLPAFAGPATMTAAEANAAAEKGDILLVDIRRPSEWRQTGIASSAIAISMHKDNFLKKLDMLMGGDKKRPVAFICATGNRSGYVQKVLSQRGYTNVISVSEGMLGGKNGRGWIPSGLPVTPYNSN